jgi:hypothetical protein
MYPPGQFAAWNRPRPGYGRGGQQSQAPSLPDRGQPSRATGPHNVPSGPGAVRPTAAASTSQPYAQPTGRRATDASAKARYYEGLGSDAEPGYSLLAVSDPAADVTSTQTWRAAGEGRATGVWTVPAGRERDSAAAPGRRSPSVAGMPRDSGAHLRDSGSRPGEFGGDAEGDELGRHAPLGPSRVQTSPSQIRRTQRRGAGRKPDPKRPVGPQQRRKRASSVRLAVATAAVLVLAAAGALSYAVLHHSGSPGTSALGSHKSTSPSVSASPSPSLGQYGHIAARPSDPTPLTMSELYPASFAVGGATVARTAASKGTDCLADLVGSRIQAAIGSAGCDQVVRATYLASSQGVMGTIGVLNLKTAKAATTVARAADASDFILQLAGKHGATTKIGQGTGIEEAAAKGHYLILIWAEFTNLRKPRTGAQINTVEQFMTELLQHTANVSLTTRMLTGHP